MRAVLFFAFTLFACTTSSPDDAEKPEAAAPAPDARVTDAHAVDATAEDAAADADAGDGQAADAVEDRAADATVYPRDAVWDGPPWTCTKLTQLPACPAQAPKYADVTPFFEKHCVSCHLPADSENMSTYDGIVYQKTNVALDLRECTMPSVPPWPTMDERQKILEWLACDAPQ
jgi:hypothetical protein